MKGTMTHPLSILRTRAFPGLCALGIVLALGLSACERKPAETASGPAPEGEGKSPGELRLYCWSEYVPQTVIDAFTQETGIAVLVENYASNEEMLTKLLTGGGAYDLIQPSEYVVEALRKDGQLLKLDHSQIPNLKNLAPEFRQRHHDPENEYSVPWMAGTVGIVVNTERIQEPVKGFRDVFKPEHAKRIVILDDAREIVSWALAASGIPTNEITAENLEKVRPLLSQWLPLVKVYDSDSPKTALLNGDVDLGVVWSGEGALLYNENKKFQWVLPEEGTHLFIDCLAIPKTSKNKRAAERFIDFILRPEISKLISDEFPYLNPNAEARKLLSEEQLSNPASFPAPEDMQRLEIFRDIGDMASEVDALITELKLE
jgi:spermidine/putrescine transport system permease protein